MKQFAIHKFLNSSISKSLNPLIPESPNTSKKPFLLGRHISIILSSIYPPAAQAFGGFPAV
jgi:hypothetical protein